MIVDVTGNGTYSANLHSLDRRRITSSLSFTDGEGNSASATGNAVALDTDKTEVATLTVDATADNVINNSKSTTVSFTVGGLDDTGTGTVTFTDGANPTWSSPSPATAPTAPTCIRSTDGSITSSLSFTDGEGNPATATGNAVALDTDKTEVATLTVDDTADNVINDSEVDHRLLHGRRPRRYRHRHRDLHRRRQPRP